MNCYLLTPVIELKMVGLKSEFSGYDLEQKAHSMMEDLRDLLNANTVLKHTVLSHSFRLGTGEHPGLMLVIGLVLSNQFTLNFKYEPIDLGMVDEMVLKDRQEIVSACRQLPSVCGLAAIEWAQIYSSACLSLPDEDVHINLSRRVNAMLGVKHRALEGMVADQPWQHSIDGLGRYKWSNEVIRIRAQLDREKKGYMIRLLSVDQLSPALRSVRKLRMIDRPRNVETASYLDRSEHMKVAVEILVRVGSQPGSDRPVVADFIGLC